MEELPNEFDVITVGTGLPESILAAACARLGWTVLHLDRNDYYGADWTNFNFESLQRWVAEQTEPEGNTTETAAAQPTEIPLEPGEQLIPTGFPMRKFLNVQSEWHIPADSPPVEAVEEICAAVEELATTETEKIETEPKAIEESDEIRRSAILDNWRKFSVDLAPKLLLSRGSFIEMLINSSVSRYAEFKLVNRILTRKEDQTFEVVPCSRSDVFQNKDISMIEKRLLMKFLNGCLNITNEPKDLEEANSLNFAELLDKKGLTPNLKRFIITSIAMVSPTAPAIDGVEAVKSFLMSTGRYGNSPFLFTCYGSGELPQCFCRMCAVFGGIYCLRRSLEAVITDANGRICAVVSQGARITCRALALESSYLPASLRQSISLQTQTISRAVLITNASLLPDDKNHLSLFSLPIEELKHPVTVLELSHSAYISPKPLFVVYLWVPSEKATAKEDLSRVVEDLFNLTPADDALKPIVLWSLYYNQIREVVGDTADDFPSNLIVTSGPSANKDLEDIVDEVKNSFNRVWPGEDFLPAVPNPDEMNVDENDPGINGFTPDPGSDKNSPSTETAANLPAVPQTTNDQIVGNEEPTKEEDHNDQSQLF